MLRIKNFFLNLNLFTNPEKEAVWDLHNQRITTRIFLLAIFMALSSLIVFTSLSYTLQTVIVETRLYRCLH